MHKVSVVKGGGSHYDKSTYRLLVSGLSMTIGRHLIASFSQSKNAMEDFQTFLAVLPAHPHWSINSDNITQDIQTEPI